MCAYTVEKCPTLCGLTLALGETSIDLQKDCWNKRDGLLDSCGGFELHSMLWWKFKSSFAPVVEGFILCVDMGKQLWLLQYNLILFSPETFQKRYRLCIQKNIQATLCPSLILNVQATDQTLACDHQTQPRFVTHCPVSGPET